MTDGESLLGAIIANPDDDTPRLVYADWLDEHGHHDRAEFIRGQIRLAGMNPWDDGFVALDIRCRQLERAHPEWLGPLSEFVSRCERFCSQRDRPFERGFPAWAEFPTAQFAVLHDSLFTHTPVRDIRFELEGPAQKKWLKLSGIERLTKLEFAFLRTPSRVKELLDCLGRVRVLKHFGLAGCTLQDADTRAVFAAPAIAGVESLWIRGTPLSDSAENTFASSAWPNLKQLVRVWVSTLEWLRAPWVNQLRELTVSDTEPNLNPDQRRLLADILPNTNIHTLELGWWALDVPGGRALGEAVAKSRVRSLAIAQTQTRADVARALFTPESLSQLRALYLSWAELDAEVIGRLAGTGLRVCGLDHITASTLAALGKQPGLPELTELRLGFPWKRADEPIPRRLEEVLKSGALPRLVSLTLCDTGSKSEAAGDKLAKVLASCPASAKLEELQLGSSVTRVGAEALAKSPHLEGLRLLNVRVWPKDPEAERVLTERFGARVFLDIVSREY